MCLRSFLRYLHGSGRTALDLSSTVIGPRIYDDEQIPSALRPEEVQTVVEATRQDCSPIGRRDYAFLMLLATYGLRAGEVVALRLEDIDWQKEILRVRHSKTGGGFRTAVAARTRRSSTELSRKGSTGEQASRAVSATPGAVSGI